MGNFFKTMYLALLQRFQKAKAVYIASHHPTISSPPLGRSAWIGSIRNSIGIVGDIISPANEESEWEALRD
jgi:hypothetical protein